MRLDYLLGIDLCNKALEKEQEKRAWDIWLTRYPNMTDKTFVPFDEFFKPSEKNEAPKRTDEEVLTDAENILKSLKRSE